MGEDGTMGVDRIEEEIGMRRRDQNVADLHATTRLVCVYPTLVGTPRLVTGAMEVETVDGVAREIEHGMHRRRALFVVEALMAIDLYNWTSASGKRSSCGWIVIGTQQQKRADLWEMICTTRSFSIRIRRRRRRLRFRPRRSRRYPRGRRNMYVHFHLVHFAWRSYYWSECR